MSRKTGHRDKPEVYDLIINHLRKHPDGQNAYSIHQALEINDVTVRTYLADLVDQKKVIGTAVTKRIIRYTLAEKPW